MNGLAYVSVAVLVFPILKPHFESIALGYFGFRIVEFVMQILADMSPLSLLLLGEDFAATGDGNATFEIAGSMLLADRLWAFEMISITFGVGALLFYYMMYRSRLFPRFISIWGFIGATAVLAYTLFDLIGFSIPDLGLLMLLNELFLGVWLIARGFNDPVSEEQLQTDPKQSRILTEARSFS